MVQWINQCATWIHSCTKSFIRTLWDHSGDSNRFW